MKSNKKTDTSYEVEDFLEHTKKIEGGNNTQNFNSNTNDFEPQKKRTYTNRFINQEQPVLQVQNVSKTYQDKTVVDNVSFNIYPSQIVGFLGTNGAGKSTTIKMITGLAKISSGCIKINNIDIEHRFESAIKNVGAIIETPHFYPYLSGFDNLKFFAKLGGNYSKEKVMQVATLVGLADRIKDRYSKYSLGMKQRLGVASALLNDPKILILDEPTNGLDANGIIDFRIMLKTLAKRQKLSILISSHILGEMENLCDNIVIIDKGKIIAEQTIEELKENFMKDGNFYIKCNAVNFASKLIVDKFKINISINRDRVIIKEKLTNQKLGEIIALLTKNKILIYRVGEIEHSLEEIFLNITHSKNSNKGAK